MGLINVELLHLSDKNKNNNVTVLQWFSFVNIDNLYRLFLEFRCVKQDGISDDEED